MFNIIILSLNFKNSIIINNYSFDNVVENMDVLIYGIQVPLVLNKINCGIRFVSIATAAGIPIDNITNYDPGVIVNLDYMDQEFLIALYPHHPIESEGYTTVHPVYDGMIDDIKDDNYFLVLRKLYRYSRLIYEKS